MVLWLGIDVSNEPLKPLAESRGTGCELGIPEVDPRQPNVIRVPKFASRNLKALERGQEFGVAQR